MIFCHIHTHKDEGMMAVKYIHPESMQNFCTCGAGEVDFPVLEAILGGAGGLILILACVVVFFLYCRRRKSGVKEAPTPGQSENA